MFPVRRANRDITDLYPYPIATAYLKLYQTGDPTGRHERLKDLFEVTTKYLASIVLAQYGRDRLADGATYGSPTVDAALLNLKRPSLGHWLGLLRQDEEVNGETHFSLLRTVPEFALEQLTARGESDEIRQNHAAYYRALAEEAEPKLTGAQQAQWLNRLEADHGNLRAALDWLAESSDYEAARELYEESLALRRELGDKRGTANLLNNLGVLARFEGDRAAVGQSLEESLRLRRQLKDKWGIANSLSSLGDLALDQGDYAAAQTFLQESLGLNLELGDRRALAFDLAYLAGLAAAQERLEYAAHLAGAAASLREEIQTPLSPAEEARVEARLRPARDALGANAYFEAMAVGRTISLEAAIGKAFGD